MAAAREVADLEYQVAQSNLESLKVRLDAGSIAWHDVQDAREQLNERYNSLQDANFELERAQNHAAAGHRRAGGLGKRRQVDMWAQA